MEEEEDNNFGPGENLDFGGGPLLPAENEWEGEDIIPLAELLENARRMFQFDREENPSEDRISLLEPILNSLVQNKPTSKQMEKDREMKAKEEHDFNQELEEGKCKADWMYLPDLVLSHLFSWLRDRDIGSAARVCKKWNTAINDPTLWRVRHIRFSTNCIDVRFTKSVVGFARRHGQHVQKLRIQCPHPTYSIAKRFQSTMTSFLHIMNIKKTDGKRCELKELSVNQLCVERYWRFENMRTRMIKSFSRFLRKQKKLVFCDFSENMLSAQDGLQILECVADAAGRNLRILNMEDFFATHLAVFAVPRYRLIMSPFHNLRSLITNYNYLNSEIIEQLASNCERRLKCLSIKAYRQDPYHHIIHPYSWKMLKKACPSLRVCLYFEAISSFPDILRIACREIPLKVVQLWTGLSNPEEYWRLDESIRYLGNNFGKTLEEACFYLENQHEEIDGAMLHFLGVCSNLEVLVLQASLEVTTVDTVCEWQRQYKIGLQRCHIAVDHLSGPQIENLDGVVDKYRPMLDFRGLDFQLTASPRL